MKLCSTLLACSAGTARSQALLVVVIGLVICACHEPQPRFQLEAPIAAADSSSLADAGPAAAFIGEWWNLDGKIELSVTSTDRGILLSIPSSVKMEPHLYLADARADAGSLYFTLISTWGGLETPMHYTLRRADGWLIGEAPQHDVSYQAELIRDPSSSWHAKRQARLVRARATVAVESIVDWLAELS